MFRPTAPISAVFNSKFQTRPPCSSRNGSTFSRITTRSTTRHYQQNGVSRPFDRPTNARRLAHTHVEDAREALRAPHGFEDRVSRVRQRPAMSAQDEESTARIR